MTFSHTSGEVVSKENIQAKCLTGLANMMINTSGAHPVSHSWIHEVHVAAPSEVPCISTPNKYRGRCTEIVTVEWGQKQFSQWSQTVKCTLGNHWENQFSIQATVSSTWAALWGLIRAQPALLLFLFLFCSWLSTCFDWSASAGSLLSWQWSGVLILELQKQFSQWSQNWQIHSVWSLRKPVLSATSNAHPSWALDLKLLPHLSRKYFLWNRTSTITTIIKIRSIDIQHHIII